MKKPSVFAITVCSAVALTASPASAATKSCSTSIKNAGNLKATNVSCKTARKVMRKHIHGVAMPLGYTCTQKQFEGGVTNTCRKGTKKVRYQLAD